MGRPLARRTVPTRVRENKAGVRVEQRKPNMAGEWIYVGDYVGFEDPANDPLGTSLQSPIFLNDFYYTSPIAFRHGLDGQTDMVGVYDLTLGAVSGDTAFLMPLAFAVEMPSAAMFPVELEEDVWSLAIQTVTTLEDDLVDGKAPVKVFWPIVATAYP